MNSNPIISGTGMGVLLGVVMVTVPWATPFPEGLLGKILMTLFGLLLLFVSLNMSRG